MEAVQYIAPAQYAYLQIPSSGIRSFVDGLFPGLAKNSMADMLSGQWHRYKHGHDLLLDVTSTWRGHGSASAMRQAGHILLTDFPTKAGIPIPGLSLNGLGGWLNESLGVSKAWLNINIFDTGIGIIAITESYMDLLQALNSELFMDSVWTFLDTFGEGAVELVLAYYTCNPLLAAGGIGNILSGLGAVINSGNKAIELASNTIIIADPFAFFGAGLVGAMIGFVISGVLTSQDIQTIAMNSFRSGLVAALCTISPLCGLGAALGFASFAYGKALAKTDPSMNASSESLHAFMQEIANEVPEIQKLLSLSTEGILKTSENTLIIHKNLFLYKSANDDFILSTSDMRLSESIPVVTTAEDKDLLPIFLERPLSTDS